MAWEMSNGIQPRPMCYEASAVWHCWMQQFFSCKSAKSLLVFWKICNVLYDDPPPFYLAGNYSFKNVLTMLAKCAGAHQMFFLWGFIKDQVYWTPVRDLANTKKEFMLLSTMSHLRFFVIHGTRLITDWIFPVPLMEAMLRFTSHNVKEFPVLTLCSNCFHLYIRISSEVIAFLLLYL